MKVYNKRVWLNKDDSPSTGNVVAFDGEVTWHDEKIRSIFYQYLTVVLLPDCTKPMMILSVILSIK